MRRLVPVLLFAASCSAAGRPAPAPIARETDAGPPAAAPAPVAMADASSPAVPSEPAPEAPLAWGTRPPRTGPLYPVIEGECLRAEAWPLDSGGALFTYGELVGSATSVGHFTDDGIEDAGQTKQAAAFLEFSPLEITGSWPEPLVAWSADRMGTRARNYESIWAHRADAGWVSLVSYRDDGNPEVSGGEIFRGHAIVQRHSTTWGAASYRRDGALDAVPIVSGATALTNIAALRRQDLINVGVTVGTDQLYAFGIYEVPGSTENVEKLRVWRDGKVRDVKLPAKLTRLVMAKPDLVLAVGPRDLRRLADGDTWEPFAGPIDGGPNDEVVVIRTPADGSVWTLVNPGQRWLRRDPKGNVEEMKPPSEPETMRSTRAGGWPRSTRSFVGIEQGDPWALSPTGTLSHWVDGKWTIVPTGSYRAEGIALAAKGDLYVVASFPEKLPGWTTGANRRAILRTRRPREVLRCNEGAGGFGYTNGRGWARVSGRRRRCCGKG